MSNTLWVQTNYEAGHGQWVVVGKDASYEGGAEMETDITLPRAIVCGLQNLGGEIETIRVSDATPLGKLENPTGWPWTDAAQLLDDMGASLCLVPAVMIDRHIRRWLLNQETGWAG